MTERVGNFNNRQPQPSDRSSYDEIGINPHMSQAIIALLNVPKRLSLCLMLGCLLGLGAGCASVESTMVTRDETNQYWERHNCLNGIPITIKVPTHLKLYVFHKHYIEPENVGANNRADNYVELDVGVVVRDFAQEFMYTEQVFFVDFKRPASGSSNLRVKMTDQQYIDAIQHDITDTTISDVRGLVAAAQGTEKVDAKTVSDETKPTDVIPIRSLVAVGIFEIAAPDFEHKVRAFMDCHVNKAHDAWVVPPGVDYINRVRFGPHDNTTVPYPTPPLCPACYELNPASHMHAAQMGTYAPYPQQVFAEELPSNTPTVAGP